jgi:hypothetical protein
MQETKVHLGGGGGMDQCREMLTRQGVVLLCHDS